MHTPNPVLGRYPRARVCRAAILVTSIAALLLVLIPKSSAWGEHGHKISGKAAALALPPQMPRFFRDAADQLAYLNPEPDRWRHAGEAALDPAMRDAFNPDHYVNFELFPAGIFESTDRFLYFLKMNEAGVLLSDGGMSPYRILEKFQQLRVQFRLWRSAPDARTRAWIEQRIINEAGILGHYVTDGANPLHTSIHHHGWIGPNPEGYATDREIHSRFESRYVGARISLQDLQQHLDAEARVFSNPRTAIHEFLRSSHAHVETLYQLDRLNRFTEETEARQNKEFTLQRMAFGVLMLRDLWWTAWVTSAEDGKAAMDR